MGAKMIGDTHDQAEQAGSTAGNAGAALCGAGATQWNSSDDAVSNDAVSNRIRDVRNALECRSSTKYDPHATDPLKDPVSMGVPLWVLRRELKETGPTSNPVPRWWLLVAAAFSSGEPPLGVWLSRVLDHCDADPDFKAGLLAVIQLWAPGALAYVEANGHAWPSTRARW